MEAAAGVAQGHLGGDPAPEGAAENGGRICVELIEQLQVGLGEVGNGVERGRA
ncbi:hypothetical protein GCM10010430_27240 [Kitasatospora cystarginea]|uniref:Uncharacterized protein n=1 Tax=Kitasatospora cystarginea TaxID=58350 RepID=A0ABP5QTG8_9ACTN